MIEVKTYIYISVSPRFMALGGRGAVVGAGRGGGVSIFFSSIKTFI